MTKSKTITDDDDNEEDDDDDDVRRLGRWGEGTTIQKDKKMMI